MTSSITVEPNGITIVADDREHCLDWASIDWIEAYKVDVFSYDLICLAFHINGSSAFHEVDEGCSGYASLVAQMEQRFDLATEWWERVAFPAFEECRTTIWRRGLDPASISPTTDNQRRTTEHP